MHVMHTWPFILIDGALDVKRVDTLLLMLLLHPPLPSCSTCRPDSIILINNVVLLSNKLPSLLLPSLMVEYLPNTSCKWMLHLLPAGFPAHGKSQRYISYMNDVHWSELDAIPWLEPPVNPDGHAPSSDTTPPPTISILTGIHFSRILWPTNCLPTPPTFCGTYAESVPTQFDDFRNFF